MGSEQYCEEKDLLDKVISLQVDLRLSLSNLQRSPRPLAQFSFGLKTLIDKLLEVLQFLLSGTGNLVPKYNLLESDERHVGFVYNREELMILLEDSVVGVSVTFPRVQYLLVQRRTLLAKQARICLSECEVDELARLLGGEVDGWHWGGGRWRSVFFAMVVKPMPYPLYLG